MRVLSSMKCVFLFSTFLCELFATVTTSLKIYSTMREHLSFICCGVFVIIIVANMTFLTAETLYVVSSAVVN